MARTASIQSHTTPDSAETVTIRVAMPGDAPALRRLAELDSTRLVEGAPMLVAEMEGEPCAAVRLDGRGTIADPFRRTTELTALLAERVRHLEQRSPRAVARHSWPIRMLQAAAGYRA